MDLTYTFEPMLNGMYQVRMSDFFVCYSTHTSEILIDDYLKAEGYKNRKEYFEACLDDLKE